MRLIRRLWVLAGCLALCASTAAGNGRFPAAQYLAVGPGPQDSTLALVTTFGLLVSSNGGQDWSWVCESAIGVVASWDPPVAFSRDGALLAGLPDGLSLARPGYCTFNRLTSVPAGSVVDLTNDVKGERLAAAVASLSGPSKVLLSDDLGVTWRAGWSMPEFYIETVDIAPGQPSRLYVTGRVGGGSAVLFRSSDGGQTFVESTRDFKGGYNAFIVAVDPTRPDVLYVRSDLTTGSTMLLRSDDGGGSFRELIRTGARMLGAALSSDGRSLWVGGPDGNEGILRSTDEGAHWSRVTGGFSTRCLRYHNRTLYACADNLSDGFALAKSTDEGEHFTPVLKFSDIRGPLACAGDAGPNSECEARWPPLQMMLAALNFPSNTDGGTGNDLDATVTDASQAEAGPEPGGDRLITAGGGCSCWTGMPLQQTATSPANIAVALALAASAALRRRPTRRG